MDCEFPFAREFVAADAEVGWVFSRSAVLEALQLLLAPDRKVVLPTVLVQRVACLERTLRRARVRETGAAPLRPSRPRRAGSVQSGEHGVAQRTCRLVPFPEKAPLDVPKGARTSTELLHFGVERLHDRFPLC